MKGSSLPGAACCAALLATGLAAELACQPQAAGTPPLVYRSPLLSYRVPQPLGYPLRGELPPPPSPLPAPAAERARSGGQTGAELARIRQEVVSLARRASTDGERGPSATQNGFILRAYEGAGWPLALGSSRGSGPADLYRIAEQHGFVRGPKAPLPADLAFFHHTWDVNGNEKLDDLLTQAALVEKVDADGTVHLLYRRRGGEVRSMLANPQHPHQRRLGQKIVNSYLRPTRKGEPAQTPHLAGEMLAGFATMIR